MWNRIRVGGVILVAAAIAAAFAAVAGGGSVAGPFVVTSTLDGKHVLPFRTHWIASPKLPAGQVGRVDFLVDGRVRWSEQRAPYVYGGDDNGSNMGFLVTTWLAPGKHRFAARVIDTRGRRSVDEVVARVLPAPAVRPELAGMWSRTVTAADLRKSGSEPPPAGAWKLVFDRVGAWHLDPMGSGVVNEYDAQPGVIHVYAPIWMAPNGVSKYGHTGLRGNDCTAAGPFGTYRFSVSGGELTLTAIREGCPNRRAIWEGRWTRAR